MQYGIKVSNKYHFTSDDEDVSDPSELLARAVASDIRKKEKAVQEAKAAEAAAIIEKAAAIKSEKAGAAKKATEKGAGKTRAGGERREDGRPPRPSGDRAPRPPRNFTPKESVQQKVEGEEDFGVNVRSPRTKKIPTRRPDNKDERKPRASGSDKTGVRSIPKREGAGKGNWGTVCDDLAASEAPADTSATENVDTTVASDTENVASEEPKEEVQKTITLKEYKAQIADAKKSELPFKIRQISEQEFKKLNLVQMPKKKPDAGNAHEVEIIRRDSKKQIINLDLTFADPNKPVRRDNRDGGERREGNRSGENKERRPRKNQNFLLKESAFPALGTA